jgi:xanthine dehydrogenase YagS FAD-binding subunit
MRHFDYSRAESVDQAVATYSNGKDASFLAGGTNLLDMVKLDIMRPELMVDVNRLQLNQVEELDDGRLKIGAMVSNAALARHPRVEKHYTVLSEALLSGASTQLCMGMATIGATVSVIGPDGPRDIDFLDFHLLPGDKPWEEFALKDNELITHVTLEAPIQGAKSAYLKLRDRSSYQFALASSGAIVALDGNIIRDARLALGGVGTKPWRALEAEQALKGQPANTATFEKAARIAMQGAKGYEHNAFKIPLGQQAIVRTLTNLTAG